MIFVYHIYCRNDYRKMVLSKFEKLKRAGLWDHLSSIYLYVTAKREEDIDFFEDLKFISSKIKIFEHKEPVFFNEADTFNHLKNRVEKFENNVKILYAHTKGSSYPFNPRMLPGKNFTVTQLKSHVACWVRYMDLFLIAKWKECVDILDTHDTCGIFMIEKEKVHYSGNFWWANSDYIKTLPYITTESIAELNRGEFWICNDTKENKYCFDFEIPVDLYHEYYMNENDFPDNFKNLW